MNETSEEKTRREIREDFARDRAISNERVQIATRVLCAIIRNGSVSTYDDGKLRQIQTAIEYADLMLKAAR